MVEDWQLVCWEPSRTGNCSLVFCSLLQSSLWSFLGLELDFKALVKIGANVINESPDSLLWTLIERNNCDGRTASTEALTDGLIEFNGGMGVTRSVMTTCAPPESKPSKMGLCQHQKQECSYLWMLCLMWWPGAEERDAICETMPVIVPPGTWCLAGTFLGVMAWRHLNLTLGLAPRYGLSR